MNTVAGPVAQELTSAIKGGDVKRLAGMLAADPSLANCLIVSPDGGGRTPLHLLADAPGGRPRSVESVRLLVDAGADLDAAFAGSRHGETALHWAASNDDVVLIDALFDAGADIEHPGSSIDGGPPIQSALGYGQWLAVRRLFERGPPSAWLTSWCSVCSLRSSRRWIAPTSPVTTSVSGCGMPVGVVTW